MKKSELVSLVLEIVENETEISAKEILSRNHTIEVVDARHLTVMLLHGNGMYKSAIADVLKVSPRYVQYIITDFEDRIFCNSVLRKTYERAAKKLRKRLEIST